MDEAEVSMEGMTEETTVLGAAGELEKSPKAPRDLESTMPSVRRWPLALVRLRSLTCAAVAAFGGFTIWEDYLQYGSESVSEPNPELIAPLKAAVTDTYGADLESVEVVQLELTYDVADDNEPDRPFMVTYKLRSSPLYVTGLVDEISDLGSTGLTPTNGSLEEQLTMAELSAVMRAYAEHSTAPMGIQYPYTTSNGDEEYTYGDTIMVGDKEYVVDDLWCVNEGWVPEGTTVKWNDVPSVRSLVFMRDRKTGTFRYVGTEPAQVPSYYSYDDTGC